MSDEEHIRFVYHDVRQPEHHTFCRVSSSGLVRTESKNIPQLHNKEVIYSSNDGRLLLLLHQNTDQGPFKLNIWKPITDESIDLPDGPHGVKFDKGQALISSSPDDPSCLVVYLFHEDSPSLLYCRVGCDEEDWCQYNYGMSIEAQRPRCRKKLYRHTCGQLQQPVSVDGRVYAFYSCGQNLVQVTVDAYNNCTTNVLVEKKEDKPIQPIGCLRNYLVPWGDDDIYRIVIFLSNSLAFRLCEISNISVSRFDFEKNVWAAVGTGLEGGRIFLGNRYSLASTSSSCPPTKWSFIYFTSKHDQVLHSYRLEDEKVTSYSPYSPDFSGPWLPHWISSAQTQLAPEPEDNIHQLEDGHAIEERRIMGNEVATGLHDLMPELIGLIAENLSSFVDYIYFLSTNIRVWNDVRMTRKNVFRPCLIYRDKVNRRYHITDGRLDRKLSVGIPEALQWKNICCSRDGWLMVYVSSYCALFNPLSSQLVRAEDPNTTRNANCGVSNLTFIGKPSPFSPENCSVLAMSLYNSSDASRMVKSGCGSGEPGRAEWWRLVLKRASFVPGCSSPVLLGDDLYYLSCDNGRLGRLRILNLKEGEFEWEEIQELESPCSRFTRNYLTECGGELVSVFIGESWVRVFRINVNKKWQETDSLRGYCLYVGSPSSVSCVAETVESADRIYFPKFYKQGLVYYSLKSKKYHSIASDQDEVTRFHPTTMFSDCVWINPNLSS